MQNHAQTFAVDVHPGELHFNSAHFITFDSSCENLHGHNFHVRIQAHGDNNDDAFVIDFVQLNRLAAEVCLSLHDKILLPGTSTEVTIEEGDGQIEVASYDKRFSLPAVNCLILPVANTTAEMLAWHIMESLLPKLEASSALTHVETLEVAVEEADNQWGICRRRIKSGRV
ncbi:6-pyruvoyl trahydropterin synthase family protein [Candidatus Thiodiazotropha sp. CDECU1]|uniref:6-pyruvoyl trahydropterin synthase family protein n=1 Tax=Candidatus Thiodiazotropha sp. CDECU1 TaxID=3065865 RepID=UPI00292D5DB2|nr:6-carboxytetrahydropterin synthase [Candidatus Thiodiazotropha sp. CDECU1]